MKYTDVYADWYAPTKLCHETSLVSWDIETNISWDAPLVTTGSETVIKIAGGASADQGTTLLQAQQTNIINNVSVTTGNGLLNYSTYVNQYAYFKQRHRNKSCKYQHWPLYSSWNQQATASNTQIEFTNYQGVNASYWAHFSLAQTLAVYPQRPETPEEKATREAADIKYCLEAEERRQRQEVAATRAEQLLFAVISEEQHKQYVEFGYFETIVNDRVYRINKGRSGNVMLIENGKPKAKFCIHPREWVPDQDTMLTQLLMLITDEQKFLATANRTLLF